ncbi:DUF721 domain-containing protein [Pleionea litopenaei]|uniref:DUF721 domain-containing protein n=1 Tax=Pleionea litopenaei TaxID=3070815 RepID=UPI00338FBE18
MANQKPKTYDSISDEAHGSLRFIFDNLARIKQLDHIVKAKLNENLAKNCRVINFRDNNLVIAAESATWATRLKFEQHDLLTALRADGFHGLRSIKIITSASSN